MRELCIMTRENAAYNTNPAIKKKLRCVSCFIFWARRAGAVCKIRIGRKRIELVGEPQTVGDLFDAEMPPDHDAIIEFPRRKSLTAEIYESDEK